MTTQITLDSRELSDMLKDLSSTAELLKSALEAFVSIVNALEISGELVRVEAATALGTDELRVTLYPTDRFRELMSALRARKRDLFVIEKSGH